MQVPEQYRELSSRNPSQSGMVMRSGVTEASVSVILVRNMTLSVSRSGSAVGKL